MHGIGILKFNIGGDFGMVSIIIPVYNNNKTIERCVNSFVEQTYNDFEIIIIDDGSTSDNAKLYDELANRYSEVSVYHYLNEGVSAARNHGIDKAQGDYIFFADSDDYVEANMLEQFIKLQNKYDVDMIIAGYYFDISCEKNVSVKQAAEEKYLKSQEEIIQNMVSLWDQSMMYNVWNKLFVSNIIKKNEIRFPIGKEFNEDRDFIREYVMFIGSLYITEEAFYHYIREDNQSATEQYRPQMLEIRKEEVEQLNAFFLKLGIYDDAKEYIVREHFDRIVGSIENVFHAHMLKSKDVKEEIERIIQDEKTKWAISNVKPKSKKMKVIHFVFKGGNVNTIYLMMKLIYQIKQNNTEVFYKMRQSR